MAKIIGKSRRRTTQVCHRMVHHVNLNCNMFHTVSFLGRFIWDRIFLCCLGRPSPAPYLRLPLRSPPSTATVHGASSLHGHPITTPCDSDSDLVNLKISLLGDCHIGKTSFVVPFFMLQYIVYSLLLFPFSFIWNVYQLFFPGYCHIRKTSFEF